MEGKGEKLDKEKGENKRGSEETRTKREKEKGEKRREGRRLGRWRKEKEKREKTIMSVSGGRQDLGKWRQTGLDSHLGCK